MRKKYKVALFFILGSNLTLLGQNVGVNTDSPTETLDIDGTLRIRNLDKETNEVYNLVADRNGVVIKGGLSNFIEAGNVYASAPKDIAYGGGSGNQQKPDLGVQKVITVPKGRKYAVVIQFSVPVGLLDTTFAHYKINNHSVSRGNIVRTEVYTFPKSFPGYVGASLLKDNVEMKQASRKVTIPSRLVINTPAAMTTISSNFYEIIDNTQGTTDKVITYKLQGYLERAGTDTNSVGGTQPQALDSGTVRFNMYTANGENYNWGYSSLTYQLYWLPTQ